MAANDHRWHEQLAPYALGLLPEEEAFFLEQHLDGCDQCRAQLRRLREHYGIADASRPTTPTVRPTRPGDRPDPSPLDAATDGRPPVAPTVTTPVAAPPPTAVGAPPGANSASPDPVAGAAAATSAGHAGAGGRPPTPPPGRPTTAPAAGATPGTSMFTAVSNRDRFGLAEVAVAVAAAVLFLVGVVTVAARGSAPAAEQVEFSAIAEGVTASAEVIAEPWGTAIHLDIDGFVPGMVYVARVRDADGDLVQAGTFTGVSGEPIAVDLAASVPRDELTEIIVTERGGDIVLVAEL